MRFTVEQVLGRGVNIIANDEMIHKNRFFDTYQWNIITGMFGLRTLTYEEIECFTFYSKEKLKQYRLRDKAKLYVGMTFSKAIYKGQLRIAKLLISHNPHIDEDVVEEICRSGYLNIFKGLISGSRFDEENNCSCFLIKNGYKKESILFPKREAIELALQNDHQDFVDWCSQS